MSNDLISSNGALAMNAVLEQAARRERPKLLNFIRRRVKTDEDAEDILQDVFYRLVTSYSVTEPIEELTSWLFRAARNRIIDWYRKRKADPFSTLDLEESLPVRLEEILFDPEVDPDTLFARSRVWTELSDALDELPDRQREVFVLHELEGKSFKEIAEITGEPVNTLLSRKRYAILTLRERLQDLYDEFLP
jgi:RNA polymerase sigma factor (sigma-70 family)